MARERHGWHRWNDTKGMPAQACKHTTPPLCSPLFPAAATGPAVQHRHMVAQQQQRIARGASSWRHKQQAPQQGRSHNGAAGGSRDLDAYVIGAHCRTD